MENIFNCCKRVKW